MQEKAAANAGEHVTHPVWRGAGGGAQNAVGGGFRWPDEDRRRQAGPPHPVRRYRFKLTGVYSVTRAPPTAHHQVLHDQGLFVTFHLRTACVIKRAVQRLPGCADRPDCS